MKAVRDVFSGSPHAYCYNHLKTNLEYRCRGIGKKIREVVLKFFQRCAYAVTKESFEEKLRRVGGHRVDAFLRDTPKEMWATTFFDGERYGQMTSNACESWNAQIRDERLLPTVSMIDGVRVKLMQQMCRRRQLAATWPTKLCRSIEMDMNVKVEQSRGWDVKKCADDIWEVFPTPTAVLDLKHKTCTCKKWQFNRLPCVHAAAVILTQLNGRYDLIESYFYTEVYKAAYANAIVPFPKPVDGGEGTTIRAPDYHQTRWRPKRRRIASQQKKVHEDACGAMSCIWMMCGYAAGWLAVMEFECLF